MNFVFLWQFTKASRWKSIQNWFQTLWHPGMFHVATVMLIYQVLMMAFASFQCADSVFSCRLHEEWSVPNLIITSDHSSTGISCFSSSLLLLSLSLFVVSGAYNSNLCPIFEKWMDKHTTLGNIAGVKCHINQVTIQGKWIIMVTH